ncbi:MAG: 50S ribosomal protein L6 [Elusimicrobiota bacterium]|nr:50S ribosomal protein L6 [Endomicrobiia bacterium]MDW8165495.1 50S ribosomal protein L6 [Elusimicrobiota bacterium]
MSKLARKPIIIPDNVKFSFENNVVKIEGPQGSLSLDIKMYKYVEIIKEGNHIYVKKKDDSKESRMYSGLYFALIRNIVKGVTEGYKKVLEIVGVGYQAQLQGDKILFKLGFSHPVVYNIPKGIKVTIDQKGQEITIFGVDKYLVGQVAAEIRSLKPPEPYKGTGIKYKDEYIIRKLGKAAIASSGGKR